MILKPFFRQIKGKAFSFVSFAVPGYFLAEK
jgi:hypothetical protein